MRADLLIEDDIVTIDRGTVFATAKDRPIPFSALAWADVLLTLDRGDFEPPRRHLVGGTMTLALYRRWC